MKLEQIEQVVEIAKQQSISRAASNLFLSQPSLSLSIQHLEEELGEPLFLRTNKGVRLTPFGKDFVSYAEAILAQTNQLASLSRQHSYRSGTKLTIIGAGYRFVTDACARLYREHKDSKIEIEIDGSVGYDSIDLVSDNLYEIGITRIWNFQRTIVKQQMRHKNVQFFPLTQVPLTIVVGRGSPLYYSQSNEVRREELSRFPQANYPYSYKGPYAGILQEAGLPPPRDRFIITSRATLFEILDKTPAYYLSATPDRAYHHTDYYPNTRSLRLADCDITAEIGWIKNESHHLSPLANQFTRILASYFD